MQEELQNANQLNNQLAQAHIDTPSQIHDSNENIINNLKMYFEQQLEAQRQELILIDADEKNRSGMFKTQRSYTLEEDLKIFLTIEKDPKIKKSNQKISLGPRYFEYLIVKQKITNRSKESLRDRAKRFISVLTPDDLITIKNHIDSHKGKIIGFLHFAGEKDHKKFIGVTLDDPITKKRDRHFNPTIDRQFQMKVKLEENALKKEEEPMVDYQQQQKARENQTKKGKKIATTINVTPVAATEDSHNQNQHQPQQILIEQNQSQNDQKNLQIQQEINNEVTESSDQQQSSEKQNLLPPIWKLKKKEVYQEDNNNLQNKQKSIIIQQTVNDQIIENSGKDAKNIQKSKQQARVTQSIRISSEKALDFQNAILEEKNLNNSIDKQQEYAKNQGNKNSEQQNQNQNELNSQKNNTTFQLQNQQKQSELSNQTSTLQLKTQNSVTIKNLKNTTNFNKNKKSEFNIVQQKQQNTSTSPRYQQNKTIIKSEKMQQNQDFSMNNFGQAFKEQITQYDAAQKILEMSKQQQILASQLEAGNQFNQPNNLQAQVNQSHLYSSQLPDYTQQQLFYQAKLNQQLYNKLQNNNLQDYQIISNLEQKPFETIDLNTIIQKQSQSLKNTIQKRNEIQQQNLKSQIQQQVINKTLEYDNNSKSIQERAKQALQNSIYFKKSQESSLQIQTLNDRMQQIQDQNFNDNLEENQPTLLSDSERQAFEQQQQFAITRNLTAVQAQSLRDQQLQQQQINNQQKSNQLKGQKSILEDINMEEEKQKHNQQLTQEELLRLQQQQQGEPQMTQIQEEDFDENQLKEQLKTIENLENILKQQQQLQVRTYNITNQYNNNNLNLEIEPHKQQQQQENQICEVDNVISQKQLQQQGLLNQIQELDQNMAQKQNNISKENIQGNKKALKKQKILEKYENNEKQLHQQIILNEIENEINNQQNQVSLHQKFQQEQQQIELEKQKLQELLKKKLELQLQQQKTDSKINQILIQENNPQKQQQNVQKNVVSIEEELYDHQNQKRKNIIINQQQQQQLKFKAQQQYESKQVQKFDQKQKKITNKHDFQNSPSASTYANENQQKQMHQQLLNKNQSLNDLNQQSINKILDGYNQFEEIISLRDSDSEYLASSSESEQSQNLQRPDSQSQQRNRQETNLTDNNNNQINIINLKNYKQQKSSQQIPININKPDSKIMSVLSENQDQLNTEEYEKLFQNKKKVHKQQVQSQQEQQLQEQCYCNDFCQLNLLKKLDEMYHERMLLANAQSYQQQLSIQIQNQYDVKIEDESNQNQLVNSKQVLQNLLQQNLFKINKDYESETRKISINQTKIEELKTNLSCIGLTLNKSEKEVFTLLMNVSGQMKDLLDFIETGKEELLWLKDDDQVLKNSLSTEDLAFKMLLRYKGIKNIYQRLMFLHIDKPFIEEFILQNALSAEDSAFQLFFKHKGLKYVRRKLDSLKLSHKKQTLLSNTIQQLQFQ